MTNNFVQLTYFFYATEVFRLVFPPFFVVLILLAGAKMLFVFFFLSKFNSCEATNYGVQEKEEQAPTDT